MPLARPTSAPPTSRTVVNPASRLVRRNLAANSARYEAGDCAKRVRFRLAAYTWTWASISPGISTRPPQSTTSASATGTCAATCSMESPTTRTIWPARRSGESPSNTLAFLKTSAGMPNFPLSARGCQPFFSPHVPANRLGDGDRTVGLLVVLENRDPGAPDGQAAAVDGVRQTALALAAGAEPNVGPPRLKIREVAAGADLAIRLLAWKPDLEIIGLGRTETEVAGAKAHDPVRQLERLQDGLGVTGELLVILLRTRGLRDLHQFDFLELVLANDAADVFSVRARLAAEAGRVAHHADRQRGGVQHFVGEKIGERNLCRRDQPQVGAFAFEQVGLELG